VNETLCRALLQARLSDEDVAARLEVDPKTVRRWLEGRVPYLRHRWALSLLVGMDESDLWPELVFARSRPGEVVAIYPHRDSVPSETWLNLFGSASREAGILADSDFPLAEDSAILDVLAKRARSGVRVRVCLANLAVAGASEGESVQRGEKWSASGIRDALGTAEFRLHKIQSYNSICYADLCRGRHKSAYAEARIMPTGLLDGPPGGRGVVLSAA
jgi:transcriptional regulator with XRE-family HTH domain